ncbi:MAG: hypothetical protein PHU41_05640 [Sulfuricurvum sp.]|nr:hypothetical protein [Sulfuricurvum sp.]
MKRGRLQFFWILCFLASMSFANTHIHNTAAEHTDCVKCFAYDIASSSDAPIIESFVVEPLPSFGAIVSSVSSTQNSFQFFFNARAPPL